MKKILALLALLTSTAYAVEWYEGGTLHGSSLMEWKKASYDNKLSTCGDWVSGVYAKKKYTPVIMKELKAARMTGIKKMAESCVVMLDTTMRGLNKKEMTNQKSPDAFLAGSVIAGWIQP